MNQICDPTSDPFYWSIILSTPPAVSHTISTIVIALIVVSVLIVLILLIIFYIYYRKKHKLEILPAFFAKFLIRYKLRDTKLDKTVEPKKNERTDVFISYCHQDRTKAFQLYELF